MKALLLAIAMAGCSFSPSAEFIQAMSQDDATICGKLHVVYGVGNGEFTYYRTRIENGKVTCKEGEMTVESKGSKAEEMEVK